MHGKTCCVDPTERCPRAEERYSAAQCEHNRRNTESPYGGQEAMLEDAVSTCGKRRELRKTERQQSPGSVAVVFEVRQLPVKLSTSFLDDQREIILVKVRVETPLKYFGRGESWHFDTRSHWRHRVDDVEPGLGKSACDDLHQCSVSHAARALVTRVEIDSGRKSHCPPGLRSRNIGPSALMIQS